MMSFTWTNIMNFTGAEDAETTTVDIPLSLGFSFFRANGLSFDDPNCAILETECSDSDGGVNYSQKGIVTYPDNSTNEDMCAWSEDFNKTVLIEYFCEDTGKTEYDCPGACYEGACINSTQNQTNQTLINCTDSDGGLNYYLKGNVSGNIGSGYPDGWQLYEDYCYGNTSLIERYCTSDYTNFTKEYSCPLGCSNGSCNIGCGDGSCNNGETCSSCSIDCWACGTSGGSSGGGGSGSSSRTQTLSIGDITTSVPLTAGKGDSISFYYKSKPHKIEITKINTNDVELRISSKTIDVIITVGETHLVDIDDDNIKDIKISLEKISSKKAYLTIDIIRQTTSVPVCNNNNLCEIGETRTNCPDDCAQESVIVTPLGEQPSYVQKIVCDYNNVCDNDETPITCPSDCKRSYNENLVVGLIVLLALMLIIGFFLFERKTNSLYNLSGKVKKEVLPLLKSNKTLSEIRSYLMFKGFNEKDISSALKYSHNFNLLRNYITKCVGWGL
jgi:hypothetical protein